MTRRDLGKLAIAGVPAAAFPARNNSRTAGVTIGVQSYSFRDRPLDAAIEGMVQAGLSYCVLWQGHVEPRRVPRDELRQWRCSVPLSEFQEIRRKFQRAGIRILAYYYSFRDDFSDEEIRRGFEMARALGVNIVEASANITTAKRVDPFAVRARMFVAMHNHAEIVPNEFARPQDFDEAMRRASRIRINLDIGHFVAAGFDPVAFLRERHKDVLVIDLKDRTRDGANLPFGEGSTPIVEVLRLLKEKKYRIPAVIEYEYRGGDAVAEVRRCYEFCRRALA